MDERFEVSADMRLLDLQRKSLGLASPEKPAWTSRGGLDLPHAADEPAPPAPGGAVLSAQVDAAPRTGLIPGALVTLTLALANGGDAEAPGVRVSLPLPLSASFRAGTLEIDGRRADDEDADALFGEGLALGAVPAGSRRTLVVRVLVERGTDDLIFAPHVSAAAGAVVGPGALRLRRGAAPAVPVEPERPFYEPDEAEDAEPLDLPAPPSVTVVQPAEMPPVLPPPPPVAIAPPPAVPQQPAPAPNAPAVRTGTALLGLGGPILTVTIDRRRLAALAALFGERSLGMIAHYLVLNALATAQPLPGDGEAPEIAAFLAAQERLLSRALISTRLGKPVAPESVAALFPQFPPAVRDRSDTVEPVPAADGSLLLVRAFKHSEITFLAGMLANAQSPPFLRAAQLFVGLSANDAVIADDGARRRVGTLLASYSALAAGEINRIFLRAKLTRTPTLFKETDTSFDDAARAVLEALAALLA
jgi:hypothetical protein